MMRTELQSGTTYSRVRQFAQKGLDFGKRFRKERAAVFCLGVVAVFALFGVIPWVFAPHSPTAIDFKALSPPSGSNIFGTDDLGRDVLSRLIWGSRVSILFGVLAATLSMALGVPLGLVAGYFGGGVDQILSRVFEIVLMIPAFFLLVMVVAIFGNNINLEILVVGVTIWTANARIMRASVISLKERQFVRAAIATGASRPSIVLRHIIPNGIQPVIVNMNLQIGQAILFEAGMSFLGLSDPNVISWGQLVNIGAFHLVDAWWLAFFPGLALALLILSFNVIGNGIGAVSGPATIEATKAVEETVTA